MPLSTTLKYLRDSRHFTVVDVAQHTGISEGSLQDFESGTRKPTPRQYEILADAYGVSSHLLSLDALPNLQENLTDFRRRTPRPAHLSPAGMEKIWSTEKVAEATKQLLDATKAPLATWKDKIPLDSPSSGSSSKFRTFFDGWKDQRETKFGFAGSDEAKFLGCFRLFIEAQGIVFRINQAPVNDFFGFYVEQDAGAPSIFINRKIASPKAQLFTAVHEYAHSLLGASGVSDPFKARNDIERKCNKFAAEFLEPLERFEKIVSSLSEVVRKDIFQFVRAASRQSLLSQHATAIRLLESGFVKQQQLDAWLAARSKLEPKQLKNEDEDDPDADTFGQVHAKIVGEVGYLPTYAAGVALEQKLISSVDITTSISLSKGIQERAIGLAKRRMELAVA